MVGGLLDLTEYSLSQPSIIFLPNQMKETLGFQAEVKQLLRLMIHSLYSNREVVLHLGTIARSGTREFFEKLTGDQQKDAQLIGQFGVGFYSAFIVADGVTVISRRAGLPAGEAVRWDSDGAGEFTVELSERSRRGTDVILHLKPDDEELLSSWKLRSILVKYSDHIATPIRMPKEQWDQDKNEYRRTGELETINQASAL